MAKPMKITKFDKPTCRLVGEAFQKLVAEFAKEYGLITKPASGRFDNNSFTPKVIFCVPETGENGETINKKDMSNFKQCAPMYGIDPEAFGKTIMLVGKKHTIVGWNPRAPKSPILIVDERGSRFKCTVDPVKREYPLHAEKKDLPKAKVGKVISGPTSSTSLPFKKGELVETKKHGLGEFVRMSTRKDGYCVIKVNSANKVVALKDCKSKEAYHKQLTHKCKYCKKPITEFEASIGVGACSKPACIQKSMREHL
jgi:hypothetical protein